MKKRLVLAAVTAQLVTAALSAAAQGLFVFANSPATAITNYFSGARASGLTVAMYFSTNTNSLDEQPLVLNPNAVTTNLVLPGVFSGGTPAVPGAPAGSFIRVRIRAWSGGYRDWETANYFLQCLKVLDVAGQSSAFVLGPLGDGTNTAPAPIIGPGGLQPFGVGTTLAPPLCTPMVRAFAEPTTFRLRIDANGSYLPTTRFQIEGSTTLAWNSWQVLTNLSLTTSPYLWTDPQGTDLPQRFYRVRASFAP